MKTFKLITLTILCCLISVIGYSQSYLTNVTPITSGGDFSTPIWSPNGEKILFTNHENNALFTIELKSKKLEKVKSGEGIGYLANWSLDSNNIIFREKPIGGTFSNLKVKSINLISKKEKVLAGVHPDNTKMVVQTKSGNHLVVYINQETLKLEAKKGVNGKPWVITKEDGQFYHPIVSPNQEYVVVHQGANMYSYRISGKDQRKDLGIGLASSWLPDSSGVVTFEDKSVDGHTVSASDLFYISARSSKKIQLTATPDTVEMWGDISPNGKQIAFSDEKTGAIFIADFNLNK